MVEHIDVWASLKVWKRALDLEKLTTAKEQQPADYFDQWVQRTSPKKQTEGKIEAAQDDETANAEAPKKSGKDCP